jgi:hypothetical protein
MALETWAQIAAIVGVPLMVIGWFVTTSKRKINKAAASRGGVANAGNVRVERAAIVTGHNSPVTVTVEDNRGGEYEKRHAVFVATRRYLDQATDKYFSDETRIAFNGAVRDAPFLFHDEGVIEYLNEIRSRGSALQAITVTLEGPLSEQQKRAASQKAGEHRMWLLAQSEDVLREKFRPFLQINATGAREPSRPDWSIRDLFLHIRPDLVPAPQNREWESVGRDVIDKFSTGQLKVWGRRLDLQQSTRDALAEIPPYEWRRAKFTYWFLDEHDGVSLAVNCARPSPGAAPGQYADLQVCQADALRLWPKRRKHAVSGAGRTTWAM